jgi:hypothetical protein
MRIRIRNTEDAVAVIAALATRSIASGGYEGHDLETVGALLTSDEILDRIRDGYTRRIGRGETPKEAVIGVGQTLIATYCKAAGLLPTR